MKLSSTFSIYVDRKRSYLSRKFLRVFIVFAALYPPPSGALLYLASEELRRRLMPFLSFVAIGLITSALGQNFTCQTGVFVLSARGIDSSVAPGLLHGI